MPRKPREHADGGWYHVYNRGARRRPIYETDADRRCFLTTLGDAVEEHDFEVHAYCLLTNHYHAVVRAPDGSVSNAMHQVGQQYAQRFNHAHGYDGPLFRSRFGSTAITGDAHLFTAVRYVVRNALDIAAVNRLVDHEWSSHPAYLGVRPAPRFLSREPILQLVGGLDRYRILTEDDRSEPCIAEAAVASAVLDVTGAAPASLATVGRGRPNTPRLLLLLALADVGGLTPAQIGGLHNQGSSTIRSSLQRARQLLETDTEFGEMWDEIKQRTDANDLSPSVLQSLPVALAAR